MWYFGYSLSISSWLLVVALALPAISLAQASGAGVGEPPGYRQAISAAVDEYEAKNYAESREHFRRAHELFPNARTLRGLGLAEYELRNYPESVRYLEQALASDVRPLEGALRSGTEQALERARGYVGQVRLEVAPAAAAVVLNGQRLEHESEETLLLPVGDHVLEFSAAGYAPQRRGITIQGGRTMRLQVELSKLVDEPAQAGAPLASEREPGRTPLYKRWWLWTSIGVVMAGAAVATVFLVRRDRHTVYDTEPYRTANTPMGLNLQPLEVR